MKKIPVGLLPWARQQILDAEKHLKDLQGNTQTLKDLKKGDILTTKEGAKHKHKVSYIVECITALGIFLKNISTDRYLTLSWSEFLHHNWWFNSSAYARKTKPEK